MRSGPWRAHTSGTLESRTPAARCCACSHTAPVGGKERAVESCEDFDDQLLLQLEEGVVGETAVGEMVVETGAEAMAVEDGGAEATG
eukprot:CAMPEP_0114307168 /NCGR_PEP_ID=MMETSP0059-20121206/17325_1 /TAXON_ID=36894 /ORGANISM="Pyramimonas parkeae, Strain CCMP726" /LENGTH=86 /DNA_ID=CAMNT_0001430613 /DNA_START=189 /DNA_END=446 /DNA_ORIENTATION=+